MRGDRHPGGARVPDDVGQVELALRVVVGEPGHPLAQPRGRRRQHAGVDLVDGPFGRRSRRAPRRSRALARRRRGRCGRGPSGRPRARSAARGDRRRRSPRSRRTSRAAISGQSPFATTVTPSAGSAASATRTASPVPRGGSCVTNVRSGAASACRTASPPWPTTTHSARGDSARVVASTCATSGLAGEQVQRLGQRRVHALALAGGHHHDLEGSGSQVERGRAGDRAGDRRKESNDTTTRRPAGDRRRCSAQIEMLECGAQSGCAQSPPS